MSCHPQSSDPKKRLIRWNVRGVYCEECGAQAGKHCIRKRGGKRYASHKIRWIAYQTRCALGAN